MTHDGKRVGAIVHDGRLDEAEELVASVASAAGLRMENERLDAELRARLEELRASRARIVEAGYRERRRVERDLHDGAQQRLMALTLNLKLARSKVEEDPAEAGELSGRGRRGARAGDGRAARARPRHSPRPAD